MTADERLALAARINASAARIEAMTASMAAKCERIPLSPEEERALAVLRGLVRLGAIRPA